MGEDKGDQGQCDWVEENEDNISCFTAMKRKAKSKRVEIVGWGSTQLLGFLEAIGKDTKEQISQQDVAEIVSKYIDEYKLINPYRKKRINCDERLQFLFGKKTIGRNKIYELLEIHYADNQDDSGYFFSSDDEDRAGRSSKKKYYRKMEIAPLKSEFASIVRDNIKLVYLKRTLVEDLLQEPDNFEAKVVGSFVRIRSDPDDYLRKGKNYYQLVQVTGVKKALPETDDILLQVTNSAADIKIAMLSDDDFSQEECDALRDAVKDGLHNKLTVAELEEKARTLHVDIIKHWLPRELAMLKMLIGRSNEKGWRKELAEYLDRKELLEKPEEQTRLLGKLPEIIAEDLEVKLGPEESPDFVDCEDTSQPSSPVMAAPVISATTKETTETLISFGKDSTDTDPPSQILNFEQIPFQSEADVIGSGIDLGPQTTASDADRAEEMTGRGNREEIEFGREVLHEDPNEAPEEADAEQKEEKSDASSVNKEVINLSDEEEDVTITGEVIPDDKVRTIWYYKDPRGTDWGPFSLANLKRWYDNNHFPSDLKVWKFNQTFDQAVFLIDLLKA